MKAHRAGHVSRTKGKRPLRLVYYEFCEDHSAALKREKFLKSGVGRRLLKEQLANPNDDILPGWRNRQTQQT
ncbi:MAG: GIY-YIG nuclease family protein [Lentisphaerae bacterium]|nr:GIY-YIG nuclease family protein [Lentisphaerota bacterium]MBT4818615.1 GIY-YIG nuclease family protein [Lentisphaerota bacterium]MBT5604487.1 GIY-YIG nuclease family protein [Lentisphaerota bacterium]MBT7060488.1 GIY-YIG nuclease family protein [Lentisphaerota bacterium]MBT7844395.1 GIY-YIG nuclease family protein [Lentisphaerota bacterium]